ncbi:MAG: hypothetical protein PVH88_14035 [Ignavibacteria bacterium]|jgi:hypothetical protein
MRKVIICFLLFTSLIAGEKKNYLAFSGGLFDFVHNKPGSFEFSVEYRRINEGAFFHPFGGFMVNTDLGSYFFGGLAVVLELTDRLELASFFSPGLYFRGNSKELGFIIEYRSKWEISYLLDNNMRIAFSGGHISNGFGSVNPGAESLNITIIVPIE